MCGVYEPGLALHPTPLSAMPGARLWLWCLWLLGLGVTRVAAEECQLGTVIVASVFVTLGVVAIVLGIVLLIVWKRNRGRCWVKNAIG